MYNYGYAYLVLINIIAFVISAVDKFAAKSHKRRVPEKTLFLLAIIGGSIGLYASMLFLRHKTKHRCFMLGVPVIITIQVITAIQIIALYL